MGGVFRWAELLVRLPLRNATEADVATGIQIFSFGFWDFSSPSTQYVLY